MFIHNALNLFIFPLSVGYNQQVRREARLKSRFASFVANRLYRPDQVINPDFLRIVFDLDLAGVEKDFGVGYTVKALEGCLDFGDARWAG
jgi:hypothetical protein